MSEDITQRLPTPKGLVVRTALPMLVLRYGLPVVASAITPPAHADSVFTVNTTADLIDDDISDGLCHTSSNTCSLRAAVMQANQLTVPMTRIELPAGTYVLVRPPSGANGAEGGDLNLTTPIAGSQVIVLNGAGAPGTIIDGNQSDRVLRVHPGRTASVANLTIRNGRTLANMQGGGLHNEGSLTIADCTIENNLTASAGGGIYDGGVLTMVRSTVRSNIAYRGGGLFANGSSTIRSSTFYANGARDGGAMAVPGLGDASLQVISSTLSRNHADGDGGGIDSEGTTFVYNTSIIDNDADHDRDEFGGIGGGVRVNAGSRFVVVNSLIAFNTVLDAPIYNDCSGTLEAYGRNYFYDLGSCSVPNTPSRGLVSAGTIGALQDNGGPTWTHALLPGSQAIDGTLTSLGCVDEGGAPLTFDQRGAARIAGVRCDSGAYEFGAVADRIFRSGFE